MSSQFSRCFPLGDGNICCEHLNGSYIVFPAYRKAKTEKASPDESQKEDYSEEEETSS